ncbi:response regulator [Alkalihalobacillus hemicellulosilyticus]|uniref:Response regulator receiver n=1 Tax=Halalkalibacter hemicellulosilyticusJCM 9152 TaxID=1236971 RepID=W4QIG0_9BACI|nr:response regulator [Halalkalibacter hemicellulosilyticus]GAE31697.1 response regulator receiver [Halalkalibacter hemicellulosilyticusJCM 9152]
MKKVFLVDDEIEVREGIRHCMDWSNNGFLFCGDAPDGEMALPLIEQEQPDIVITDIKMPFMDGLELSRIIRDKLPYTKIIILSGHDEFEYAREALRIQITEYCLKPLNATDLLDVLQKLSKQIDLEKNEREKFNELQNKATENEHLTKNQFLLELCEGMYSTTNAIKEAGKFNIQLIASYYAVVMIETQQELHSLIHSSIRFQRNGKETVYILKAHAKPIITKQIQHIQETFKASSQNIFGIGSVKDRIQDIPISYQEAYAQVYNNRSFYAPLPITGIQSFFNRSEMKQFLSYGQTEEIEPLCRGLIKELNRKSESHSFIYYYFLMEFTATVTDYLKSLSNNSNDHIVSSIQQIELNQSIHDSSQLASYMTTILTEVIQLRNQLKSKNYPLIQKAKAFMREYYTDPQLSLQKIADVVNVSPAYFSHIFSQEEGQTIKEYLTFIRIERAKELLITTNEKTYEIALKVGYSDSHYFCNMFKRITTMTTREFKRKSLVKLNEIRKPIVKPLRVFD